MTLRDKFSTMVLDKDIAEWEKECEQIADDYAIEVLNWYISKSSVLSIKYIGKTSEELLEMFKKEL